MKNWYEKQSYTLSSDARAVRDRYSETYAVSWDIIGVDNPPDTSIGL